MDETLMKGGKASEHAVLSEDRGADWQITQPLARGAPISFEQQGTWGITGRAGHFEEDEEKDDEYS